MACDPLHFSGLDAAKWTSLREKIESEYGIAIDSDEGEASSRGFKLRWAYEPDSGELELQCLGKPFIVPCSVVNGYINSAAEKFV